MPIDPITTAASITGIKAGLDLFRSALGLAKDAKDLLKDGTQKTAISVSLEEADRVSRIAEAQIAQALGYHLCQCTFPPQIMLSIGCHESQGKERFECPACRKKKPNDHYFERLDHIARQRRTIKSNWMA